MLSYALYDNMTFPLHVCTDSDRYVHSCDIENCMNVIKACRKANNLPAPATGPILHSL